MNNTSKSKQKKNRYDLWNSQLYRGASFTELDNPVVKTTAVAPPKEIIAWTKAKAYHKRQIANGNHNYTHPAFIHFYTHDYEFDGEREGIWRNWQNFYAVASHFAGIIGPDFSTCADFPDPLKRMQFHKMRVIEYGANARNIPVIVNARWGTEETWDYCFDAVPAQQMLCIGTVGSGLKHPESRPPFERGLRELVRRKQPSSLVVVGSDRYSVFDELKSEGLIIYQLDSDTCAFYKKMKKEKCDV